MRTGQAGGDAATGAAMAGGGVYNAHSQPQRAAAGRGLELLVRAARLTDPGEGPIVLADYGSAEGRNSLMPMRAAIAELRQRHAGPITVVHLDRPRNDFGSLFALLRDDPESYLCGNENVFALASGGSFFEEMLPQSQVSLGWSSIALHWLSGVPADANRHVWPSMLSGPAREPFARQAALDWQAFLAQRGKELRPGGRAVIVVPTEPSDGSPSLTDLIRRMIAVLQDMVRTDKLRAAELTRMIIPIYHRSVDELRAPFRDPKLGLVLEELDNHRTPDPIWEAFLGTGDQAALADGYAGFVKAAFTPTLANALDRDGIEERRRTFGECLDAGIRQLVAAEPAMLCSPTVATMLIAKPGIADR